MLSCNNSETHKINEFKGQHDRKDMAVGRAHGSPRAYLLHSERAARQQLDLGQLQWGRTERRECCRSRRPAERTTSPHRDERHRENRLPDLCRDASRGWGVRNGIAESTAVSGGSLGTLVAISLGKKPLLPGTYSAINIVSTIFAAFPFQPGFAIGNLSEDLTTGQLCPASNRAATASITITEVQVEQLEKRFHIMKLTASSTGAAP